MSRARSQIEWDESRDRHLMRDLGRFRGRAIGRRIKELMTMGLEAERLGMRVAEVDGKMVVVAGGLIALGTVSESVMTRKPVVELEVPEPAPDLVDAEHQQGLEGLLEGMGISFG
jgi:hypothetical protein